jgi:hypothetical protein
MSIILLDGIQYLPHKYENEEELEEMVEEHSKSIFGEEALYFGKKKLTSVSGVAAIPDAYAIMFSEEPRWFVIEVELESHDVNQHIVPQLNKFINGIKSDKAKRDLIHHMDNEIRKDVIVAKKITDRFGEIYKFLSDVVYKDPTYLVIIDEKTQLLFEAIDNLQANKEVIEFKTYLRENVGKAVHAHLVEIKHELRTVDSPVKKHGSSIKSQTNAEKKEGYEYAQITAFTFNGERHEVKTWREMLVKLANIMASLHKYEFENVLGIVGRKRPYFTKSSNKLRVPEKINNTDIFVEVHLSANGIARLANKMITSLGHNPDDLTYELDTSIKHNLM